MNKKILIIINNLGVGGAERLVVDDVKEMLRIGVDVTLVTLRPEPQKSFARELSLGGDNFKCISFYNLFDVSSWFKLVRFIRKSKSNLVITHLWFANTIGRIAAAFAGAKNIISFEQNVYDTVKTRKMFFIDWCLQFFSTKIIAVSEAVKKSLIRHGIQKNRIEIIRNSVDLSKFSSTHNRSALRTELGIPEDTFLYVFIGRLIHQKAVDVLIKAFKNLNLADPNTNLLIVGQGKDRGGLEDLVRENGLDDRVVFAGVRNDIPQILFSSDCFILPSRHEGLPLVLAEALASGAAIIVSDFEAAGELITHEKNGLIVPREDVPALAEAMGRIKTDTNLRTRLAMEAKKSAESLSISNHVGAILGFLKPHDL